MLSPSHNPQISVALLNIKYNVRSENYKLKGPLRMIFIAKYMSKVFKMSKIRNLTRCLKIFTVSQSFCSQRSLTKLIWKACRKKNMTEHYDPQNKTVSKVLLFLKWLRGVHQIIIPAHCISFFMCPLSSVGKVLCYKSMCLLYSILANAVK